MNVVGMYPRRIEIMEIEQIRIAVEIIAVGVSARLFVDFPEFPHRLDGGVAVGHGQCAEFASYIHAQEGASGLLRVLCYSNCILVFVRCAGQGEWGGLGVAGDAILCALTNGVGG